MTTRAEFNNLASVSVLKKKSIMGTLDTITNQEGSVRHKRAILGGTVDTTTLDNEVIKRSKFLWQKL